MKSIKYVGWLLYTLILVTVTHTISNASPVQTPPKQQAQEELNFQDDLESVLYVPLHVTSRQQPTTRIKTVRNSWVSINGSGYQPFKVGEKIRLVKQDR